MVKAKLVELDIDFIEEKLDDYNRNWTWLAWMLGVSHMTVYNYKNHGAPRAYANEIMRVINMMDIIEEEPT